MQLCQQDGGELQHPAQPHRVVVQPVRTGKPQRLPRRRRTEPGEEDPNPLGHLEAEWSPLRHQIRYDEDQKACNQQLTPNEEGWSIDGPPTILLIQQIFGSAKYYNLYLNLDNTFKEPF